MSLDGINSILNYTDINTATNVIRFHCGYKLRLLQDHKSLAERICSSALSAPGAEGTHRHQDVRVLRGVAVLIFSPSLFCSRNRADQHWDFRPHCHH